MDDRHLIDAEAIEKIKEQGCCMGKYRVRVDNVFYCYLEGIFDCPHQNRKYVKSLNSDMALCMTNHQFPCKGCPQYVEITEASEIESHEVSQQ